jgi:hypothetical protein
MLSKHFDLMERHALVAEACGAGAWVEQVPKALPDVTHDIEPSSVRCG